MKSTAEPSQQLFCHHVCEQHGLVQEKHLLLEQDQIQKISALKKLRSVIPILCLSNKYEHSSELNESKNNSNTYFFRLISKLFLDDFTHLFIRRNRTFIQHRFSHCVDILFWYQVFLHKIEQNIKKLKKTKPCTPLQSSYETSNRPSIYIANRKHYQLSNMLTELDVYSSIFETQFL